MNAIALRTDNAIVANDNTVMSLPRLVMRAANQLATATTAAEILDAKATANLVYDAAKAAARFAKAKGAFDDVMGAVYRAQADALEIEATAKRRLADEYDAAQERGDVRTKRDAYRGQVGGGDLIAALPPTQAEIGLTKYIVADARKIRDAEVLDPGFVKRELDALIDAGIEPTKEAINKAASSRLNSFSGDNEWYTPARYIEMARTVMGTIDVDPASNEHAQRTIRAATYYTDEDNGLDRKWEGTVWLNPPYSNPEVQQFVDKVISEVDIGRTTEAIVLTNNSGDTGWHQALQLACTAMCIVKGRIRFESITRASNSPAMGQSFFYFGDDMARFKDVFSDIGRVWVRA